MRKLILALGGLGILFLLVFFVLGVISSRTGSDIKDQISDLLDGSGVATLDDIPTRNAAEFGMPVDPTGYPTDQLVYGGPPDGGYTLGWTIPEVYAQNATRTVILPFIYHHFTDSYGVDISTTNVSNNFIPAYSTLNGTVIEVDNSDPAAHVYGDYVRLRNAKAVCVNNEIVYRDCRDGMGNKLFGASQPDLLQFDKKGRLYIEDGDYPDPDASPPVDICRPQIVWGPRQHCMRGETADSFVDGRLPNLGYGKSANYEVVIGHLTEGRIPSEVSVGSTIDNEQGLGNMGTSGVNPDTGDGNTLTPMVHYEVWEAQGCPQTTFVAVDPVQFFNQPYSGDPASSPPAPCCPPFTFDASLLGGTPGTSIAPAQNGSLAASIYVVESGSSVIITVSYCADYDEGHVAGDVFINGVKEDNLSPLNGGARNGCLTKSVIYPAGSPLHIQAVGHAIYTLADYNAYYDYTPGDPNTTPAPDWLTQLLVDRQRLCTPLSGLDSNPGREHVNPYGYDGNPFPEAEELGCASGFQPFSNHDRLADDQWSCEETPEGDIYIYDPDGGNSGKKGKDALAFLPTGFDMTDYTFFTNVKLEEGGQKIGIGFREEIIDQSSPYNGQVVDGYHATYVVSKDFIEMWQTKVEPDCSNAGLTCAPEKNLHTLDDPMELVPDVSTNQRFKREEWKFIGVRVQGSHIQIYDDIINLATQTPLYDFDDETFANGTVGLTAYMGGNSKWPEGRALFKDMTLIEGDFDPIDVGGAKPDEGGKNLYPEDLLFGIGTGYNSSPAAQKAYEAGATMSSIGFNWPDIETSKGNYDWTSVNVDLRAKSGYDFELLGIIAGMPSWMSPNPSCMAPAVACARTLPTQSPENIETFQNFIEAAVKHNPEIRYWQFWNEPDGIGGGPVSAADYTFWLQLAYEALKDANPDALLAAGGLQTDADGRWYYVQEMYDAGAKGNFDAMAIHPYNYTGLLYGDAIEQTYAIMETNGDGALPIWITEYGWEIGDVSESEQAAYLDDALNKLTSGVYPYVEVAIYLSLFDLPNGEQWGIMQNASTPRQAYGTFQQYALNP